MAVSPFTLSRDPRLVHLHEYWRSRFPAPDVLPGRQHIDPLHIPTLLPWIWLVDVGREPLRFKIRLFGTGHARVLGRDYTSQWLDEAFPLSGTPEAMQEFAEVVERVQIGYRRGPPLFDAPGEITEVERLLLPLARNGRDVDMLLALTVYHLPRHVR